jgi:uncharacterized protein
VSLPATDEVVVTACVSDPPHRTTAGLVPATETSTATVGTRSVAQAMVLTLLRAYQALRSGHPSPCRFYPTCSTYAVEAVAEHGAWRGSWLALRRVARCHPFGHHGVDLVPPVGSHREAER